MFLSHDTVEAFARKRNPVLSFPFLKENGELLSISVDAGFLIEPRALDLYQEFYSNAFKLTTVYPQYCRFTLGMALDLEKLGIRGNEGHKIAKYIQDESLVLFDTSDTRRLETITMLKSLEALNDANIEIRSTLLENIDRLISNPDWYTKFNKPLFYDLTHIIFFLTENGTQPLPLNNDVHPCLINMGLLSILDNDADLLAEVCICLKYINRDIPAYWDEYLQKSVAEISVSYTGTVQSALNASVDEYHIYLVLNWYQAIQKRPSFNSKFQGRTPSFSIPNNLPSPLAKLSNYSHEHHFGNRNRTFSIKSFLADLNENESAHWHKSLLSLDGGERTVQKFLGI